MYVMKDTTRTIWYIDLAWFWIHSNREQMRNKIMKELIEVVSKLISLEELNPLAILYNPNQSCKNKNKPIELKNNNRKGNKSAM